VNVHKGLNLKGIGVSAPEWRFHVCRNDPKFLFSTSAPTGIAGAAVTVSAPAGAERDHGPHQIGASEAKKAVNPSGEALKMGSLKCPG
jgi:hypothetical protein